MWPPQYQPFITGRLAALASAGVDIWVVTSNHGRLDTALLPFARIIRLPGSKESASEVLRRTLAATAIAIATKPMRLIWLLREARRRTRGLRSLARWWADAV